MLILALLESVINGRTAMMEACYSKQRLAKTSSAKINAVSCRLLISLTQTAVTSVFELSEAKPSLFREAKPNFAIDLNVRIL